MRFWQLTAIAMSATLLFLWQNSMTQTSEFEKGKSLYSRHCVVCHGERGKGDGPLAKLVKPPVPDLTEGVFKFRSTPSGTLPTEYDLRKVISEGISSTPMVGLKGVLSEKDIRAIVTFIKTLCPDFQTKGSGNPISINPPKLTPDLLKLGHQIYFEFQCNTCHGPKGEGDGPLAKKLKDKKGRPIQVLSFRNARNFKGGHAPSEIYKSIMTGLDGTPMASFAEVLTEKEGWAVSYFVHSLVEKKSDQKLSGISVKVAKSAKLPLSPNDILWSKVPVVELPLQSMWRTNEPDAVKVRVATDGQNAVFRLNWDDKTRNDKGKSLDAIAIQIPQNPKSPVPSLFWGDKEAPVLAFQWIAGKGSTVFVVRGVGNRTFQKNPIAKAQSLWQKGQWSVTLLVQIPKSSSNFPFAISVWDAALGDEGEQRSITGWHWLRLNP